METLAPLLGHSTENVTQLPQLTRKEQRAAAEKRRYYQQKHSNHEQYMIRLRKKARYKVRKRTEESESRTLIKEEEIRRASERLSLHAELVGRRRLEGRFRVSEEDLAMLRRLETSRPSKLSGQYDQQEFDIAGEIKVSDAVRRIPLLMDVVKKYFYLFWYKSKGYEEPDLAFRASVRMWGNIFDQIVHADAVSDFFIAVIIHLTDGPGTRFIKLDMNSTITCCDREELLGINWGMPGELASRFAESPGKAQLLHQEITRAYGAITTKGPSYWTKNAEFEEKRAGDVTLFLANALHYGPGTPSKRGTRETIFTTIRPACELLYGNDEIQWNPLQVYLFMDPKNRIDDNGYKKLRKLWSSPGYGFDIFTEPARESAKNANSKDSVVPVNSRPNGKR